MPKGYVYFTSNRKHTVLYAGVTSDLKGRIYKHKKNIYKGFASRYNCDEILYFEEFTKMADVIKREKQVKRWRKDWKWKTIQEPNPDLNDLSSDWFDLNRELKK